MRSPSADTNEPEPPSFNRTEARRTRSSQASEGSKLYRSFHSLRGGLSKVHMPSSARVMSEKHKDTKAQRHNASFMKPSVSHRIDDEVHTEPIGLAGEFFWIAFFIHVFPRVAEIRVIRCDNHQTAFIIRHTVDSRFLIIWGFPAG